MTSGKLLRTNHHIGKFAPKDLPGKKAKAQKGRLFQKSVSTFESPGSGDGLVDPVFRQYPV